MILAAMPSIEQVEMGKARRDLGIWGENKATEFLKERGYTILGKNIRTSYGEIDIVAWKNDIIVFVEVKTRRTKTFGFPEESITPGKRAHMINSAEEYIMTLPGNNGNWQIDVISIEVHQKDYYKIIHFENAIVE